MGHTLLPPEPTGRAHCVLSLLAKGSACQVEARVAVPGTYAISWVDPKVVKGNNVWVGIVGLRVEDRPDYQESNSLSKVWTSHPAFY